MFLGGGVPIGLSPPITNFLVLELVGSDDVEEDTSSDTILKKREVFGGIFFYIFYVNYKCINIQRE